MSPQKQREKRNVQLESYDAQKLDKKLDLFGIKLIKVIGVIGAIIGVIIIVAFWIWIFKWIYD
jgi:hypothetical protein